MKMNIGFRLKPGRDDVIIKWLEGLGENDRSYYIREALRNYLSNEQSNNRVSNNASGLPVQAEKDDHSGKAEVSKRKSGDVDQEKISELEVNLNNWLDTV